MQKFFKLVKSCRDGFVSGIKKSFGIKSPSQKPISAETKEETAMKSFTQMAKAMNDIKISVDEIGEQVLGLIRVAEEYNSLLDEVKLARMRDANNWKKMHGIPMRRKTLQERKRGKQNDTTGNVGRIQ